MISEGRDGLDAARSELADMLQRMVSELGPRECAHGFWEGESGPCDCTYNDTKPVTNGMVTEFVLVMNVTTMLDGEPFTVVHTNPRLLNTHVKGLLHTALYEV